MKKTFHRISNALAALVVVYGVLASGITPDRKLVIRSQSASAQTACDTQIRDVTFTGKTSGSQTGKPNINTNVRSNTTTSASVLTTIPPNTNLTFSGWAYGAPVNDIWTGKQDYRWFRVNRNGKMGWVASGVIWGNPPSAPTAPDCSAPPPPPPPPPSGQIILPFNRGETWYVCQGYNGTITHQNYFALDLSIGPDFGNTACRANDGNTSRSANRQVLAPAAGKILYIRSRSDLVCLSIDSQHSLLIGHISRSVADGASVRQGEVIGITSRASSINGKFSHIHLEGRKSSDCNSNTSVPLTASNGFQLIGIGDLPGGARNAHFKRALTRP